MELHSHYQKHKQFSKTAIKWPALSKLLNLTKPRTLTTLTLISMLKLPSLRVIRVRILIEFIIIANLSPKKSKLLESKLENYKKSKISWKLRRRDSSTRWAICVSCLNESQKRERRVSVGLRRGILNYKRKPSAWRTLCEFRGKTGRILIIFIVTGKCSNENVLYNVECNSMSKVLYLLCLYGFYKVFRGCFLVRPMDIDTINENKQRFRLKGVSFRPHK